MINRRKSLWPNLSQSLGFVPGVIVLVFGVLGVVLVEIDEQLDLDGAQVFKGDGSAARTVFSVIAGSLITVAGLTFSTTMVVLQLAASQFSPRILRTFFGDRVTQVTIGVYVGTFVYAILVLRAVGSFGDAGFVPRLSVTLASLLGIGAVILLVVFLHHVSRLIQVSHVIGVSRGARSSSVASVSWPPVNTPASPQNGAVALEGLGAPWCSCQGPASTRRSRGQWVPGLGPIQIGRVGSWANCAGSIGSRSVCRWA